MQTDVYRKAFFTVLNRLKQYPQEHKVPIGWVVSEIQRHAGDLLAEYAEDAKFRPGSEKVLKEEAGTEDE